MKIINALIKIKSKLLDKYDFHKITVISILSIMLILGLVNINNRYMFVDESVEAMLGQNITKYKIPKAWDGENLVMVYVNGNEFNDDLVFIRKNWLTSYLTAMVQYLSKPLNLDKQTVVGIMRSVFVIIGFIGAIAYYYLVRKITKNRNITVLSLLFFCSSVPLLLYIRSIYYLAPVLTCSISVLLFYLEYIDHRKTKDLMLFVLSAVLLFHSFYPYFFIMMFVLGILFLLYDRKKIYISRWIIPGIIITVMTLPWYIYVRSFLSKIEKSPINGFDRFVNYLLGYIWQIHAYFFPFITLTLLALLILVTERSGKKNIASIKNKERTRTAFIILLPIGVTLFAISITNSFLDTRRLITAIPFLYIAMAYLVNYICEKIKHLGYFVIIILLLTNILHIMPYRTIKILNINTENIEAVVKPPVPFFDVDYIWRNKKMNLDEYINQSCSFVSYLISYLEEISNDYDDADEGMILFLKKYAQKGQKVYLIGSQYETIAFYTGLQVVNRLDPALDSLPSAFHSYPNALKYESLTRWPILECDWIIERGLDGPIQNEIWHNERIFEKIYIDYPDSQPWNEVWAHSFFKDKKYPGFIIYRNKITTKPVMLNNNIFKKEDSFE